VLPAPTTLRPVGAAPEEEVDEADPLVELLEPVAEAEAPEPVAEAPFPVAAAAPVVPRVM